MPTPTLQLKFNDGGGYDCMSNSYDIIDQSEELIAKLDTRDFKVAGEARELGERLVTRYNAHAALVEALRRLAREYKSIADSGDCGYWSAEEQPEYQQAIAALTLAEGGTPTCNE